MASEVHRLGDCTATGIGDRSFAGWNIVRECNCTTILYVLNDAIGTIIGICLGPASASGTKNSPRQVVGEHVGRANGISPLQQEVEVAVGIDCGLSLLVRTTDPVPYFIVGIGNGIVSQVGIYF